MSIVITGATGHLGRLVVEDLLAAGVPAGEIVATGRNIDSIADLRDRGVQVRRVDFGDASTLDGLFTAGDGLDLEPERPAGLGQELAGQGIVVGDENAFDGHDSF